MPIAGMQDAERTMLRARARELEHADDWGPQALSVNEALLELAPDDQPAAIRASRCLRALGRLDEAAALLVGVLVSHRGNAVARTQLTLTMSRREAKLQAEELDAKGEGHLAVALEIALDEDEDHDLQIEGRRLLAGRERSVAAACALGAAQRAARDHSGARHSLCWALALAGDDRRAAAPAHAGLAHVLMDQGELRTDLAPLREARTLLRDAHMSDLEVAGAMARLEALGA
jgi:tetratricopeptide (TPR) repeat protein